MYSLIEMLRYKRPQGSSTQKEFCERFLEPHFGLPDINGNYILRIGDNPKICFASHHDTVHKTEGLQKLVVTNNIVSVADPTISSCLGADCTTGVWLMMGMIEAGVEGMYVVHAAEESGCVGSSALVKSNPYWLTHIDAVISFDRFGDNSVITHQMGRRTASDDFARSFATALNLPQLVADTGGSYTDSNEYADKVPECTNISVGYYGQHGVNETQDLEYADLLMYALTQADWAKLVISRDPSMYEMYYDDNDFWKNWGGKTYGNYNEPLDNYDTEDINILVMEHPDLVARMLIEMGFTPDLLIDEAKIESRSYTNDYVSRKNDDHPHDFYEENFHLEVAAARKRM